MALNYIWIALFVLGFLVGVLKMVLGDYEALPAPEAFGTVFIGPEQ